jgi:hypothetical protein
MVPLLLPLLPLLLLLTLLPVTQQLLLAVVLATTQLQ